jgi:hypothetical protein
MFDFLDEMVNGVERGEMNPLSVYIDLKRLEEQLEAVKERVKPLMMEEVNKYPEKSFKAFGAIIEKKAGASRWDYSNVKEWLYAKQRLVDIEAIAKVGGFDESGNEIQRAHKVQGKETIAVKLVE